MESSLRRYEPANKALMMRSRLYILLISLPMLMSAKVASSRSTQSTQSESKPRSTVASTAEVFFDAVGEGKVDVVRKILLETPTLMSALDKGKSTPLHIAVINKQEEMVKFLLEKKADPNAKNERDESPLHLAVFWTATTESIIELLLTAKADPNLGNYKGDTPLHQTDSEAAAELLLSKGGNTGVRNEDGWTPLHTAAFFGRERVVQVLLKNKATVNAVDNQGNTPLHLVADSVAEDRRWVRDMVEILLTNKADPNAKNKSGRTPLKMALEHKDQEVSDLLRRHGAKE